jgi:hypothetical protein
MCFRNHRTGVCGSVVGWGTMLRTVRSRVWFPIKSFFFSIELILSAALWPWGRLSIWKLKKKLNSHSWGWSPNWVHSARRPLNVLLYLPWENMMMKNLVEWKIGRGNRSTRRKPAPAPLYPPQIPLDQTRARTRSTAVGSQRLTAGWPARMSDKLTAICEPIV